MGATVSQDLSDSVALLAAVVKAVEAALAKGGGVLSEGVSIAVDPGVDAAIMALAKDIMG